MSMNMDGGGSTDYSDFEYQQLSARLSTADSTGGTDTNVDGSGAVSFDVLGGIGGLDNNEVAELVYLETNVIMEFEDEVDDQNVGTDVQGRGVIGADLPLGEGAFIQGKNPVDGQLFDLQNTDDSFSSMSGNSTSDDRMFQLFTVSGGHPFDDETNGVGGSANHENFYAEKPWRELTGRGPVLDASDDIVVALDINAGDSIISQAIEARFHMVWDVAEVSDAGRAFSVPK